MIYSHIAAVNSAVRGQRAVELSACDLAGDEEYPLQGKRGGRYKLVNGRKVYKPGSGGGKTAAGGGKKTTSQGKGGGGKQGRAAQAEAEWNQQRKAASERLRQLAKEKKRQGVFSNHSVLPPGETRNDQAETNMARMRLTHLLTQKGALQTARGGGGSSSVAKLPADSLLMTAFDAWQKEFLGNSQMMAFEESKTAEQVKKLIEHAPTELLEDVADYVSRVIARPFKPASGSKGRKAVQEYLMGAFARPRKPTGYDREEGYRD